ncbi:MAG: hypothetical protein AB7G06_05650 [Bdellovibrionales bacterium]
MKNFITYITSRLKERSTWLGLVGLLAAVGITLNPELQEAIISVGIAVASAIAMLTGDR